MEQLEPFSLPLSFSLSLPLSPSLSLSLLPPSLTLSHFCINGTHTYTYTCTYILHNHNVTHAHILTGITQNLVPLRIIFYKVTQTCVWYRNVTVVLVIPSLLAGSQSRVMPLTPVPSAALSLAQ